MRINYVDNLKGFAIILVIVGHVIQYLYSPDFYDGVVVFRYIYSFHMALFMMLSGFTLDMNRDISLKIFIEKIKKRALQLLLPFFFWGGKFSII